jgi:hypothetical protein
MADSTTNDEIIELVEDKIQTKRTGKVSTSDAAFLLLAEIRDLLITIEENTRPT